MRNELISLLARELAMQKERGLQTLSVSRVAEAVCFSFDICRSETNSKPLGHTTLRIELGEKIEEYKENKEIYNTKK